MPDQEPLPDLGYVFYPFCTAQHPGSSRLAVVMREQPTNRHFDPEQVQIPVATGGGAIEQLKVVHPWRQGADYRACAGRIILRDRKDKVVAAFSFGGRLHIATAVGATVATLDAPAPIFPLGGDDALATWIAAEVEIVLAQQRACWNPQHPHNFTANLAAADPLLLYACCLRAIEERLAARPAGNALEVARRGRRFVTREICRLEEEGHWPAHPPTPAELLR